MEWLCCRSGRNLWVSLFFSILTPSFPPSITLLLSPQHYYTVPLPLSKSPLLYTFIFPPPDFLRTPPISVATCWETLVKSDDAPFQQWHLINGNLISGMSREEVVFFHELLYNRITQPEGQVSHHRGLRRLRWSSLKMNFEYCPCWLTGCAWL